MRIEIEARPIFLPLFEPSPRFRVLVAHRRAGKTVACVQWLVVTALRSARPATRCAYVAPFYRQAKDAAWEYLKRMLALVPGVVPNEAELRVDLPHGARIRLYGADNADALRGIYLDAVVLDEFGDMDPGTWSSVLLPALADREGKATFIGTPKGRNGFWRLYDAAASTPDWWRALHRASETGILGPAELAAQRRLMTAAQYAGVRVQL